MIRVSLVSASQMTVWLIQESDSALGLSNRSLCLHVSSFITMHKHTERCTVQAVLAGVEADALRYVAATQRAALHRPAAAMATAHMTTGQEDDLRPGLHADHTLRGPRPLHWARG